MTFGTLLRVAVFSAVVLFVTPFAYGQSDVITAKASSEILHLILPGAMRDNNIDMWIHVTHGPRKYEVKFFFPH